MCVCECSFVRFVRRLPFGSAKMLVSHAVLINFLLDVLFGLNFVGCFWWWCWWCCCCSLFPPNRMQYYPRFSQLVSIVRLLCVKNNVFIVHEAIGGDIRTNIYRIIHIIYQIHAFYFYLFHFFCSFVWFVCFFHFCCFRYFVTLMPGIEMADRNWKHGWPQWHHHKLWKKDNDENGAIIGTNRNAADRKTEREREKRFDS